MMRIIDALIKKLICFISLLVVSPLFAEPYIENIRTPPGQMVEVDSYDLHIHCVGEKKPAVILESGLGGFSLDWVQVQELLKNKIMVCAYDRAGYGWSEHGPSPRVTEQIVEELHTLLKQIEIEPPYILVGHSFGGYTVQYFSKLYPRLTAGMVLIESSHPDQFSRMPDIPSVRERSGNARMVSMFDPSFLTFYPEQYRSLAFRILTSEKFQFAQQREYLNFTQSGVQVGQINRQLDVPLAVITRGERSWKETPYGDQQEQIWKDMQAELLALSTESWQIIAEESGHLVHFQQPSLVADTILSVAYRYCHQQNNTYKDEVLQFCISN